MACAEAMTYLTCVISGKVITPVLAVDKFLFSKILELQMAIRHYTMVMEDLQAIATLVRWFACFLVATFMSCCPVFVKFGVESKWFGFNC